MSDGYGNPSQPDHQPPSYPDPAAPPGRPPAPAPASGDPFGRSSSTPAASTWLALGSLVAIVVAVSVKESSRNGWDDYALWSGFAIACAAALLAPVVRNSVNLTETRAWQVAAGGAAGLAFFWILFVLPSISRNVSFVATLGVIAAGLSVWLAPGRPDDHGGGGSTW